MGQVAANSNHRTWKWARKGCSEDLGFVSLETDAEKRFSVKILFSLH